MNCPKCHKELQRRTEHGVEIDICDRHGIWFDPGELDRYAEHQKKRESLPKQAKEYIATTMVRKPCPSCRSLGLREGEIDMYVASRCESCLGIWIQPAKYGNDPGSLEIGFEFLDVVLKLIDGIASIDV